MAIRAPLPFVNYTSRDWDSIRAAIFDYLKKKFPEDWTDVSESNLGVAFVEIVAYAFEVLSFAMDRAVNETFITTAQERDSVIKLASLLGYKLSSATAASVDLVVTEDSLNKLTSPVVISAGTSISAGDITFEVDKDYTIIKVGSLWSTNGGPEIPFGVISAIEGQTLTESFAGTGEKFQVFTSTRYPYIDKSVYVTVDGLRWQEVSSLVLGDTVDATNQNIYEVILDTNDRLSIKFGDGVTGNIPSEDAAIVVYQRIGGGETGNVAAGAISSSITCTSAGVSAKVNVVNTLSASGGTDRESTEHAKIFAPIWGRTTDRVISYNDYVAVCNGFSDGQTGRIAKAGVVAQPTDGLSNVVTVYIWSEDSRGNLVPASTALKSSLLTFLNDRKVITVYISPIQDGENILVDFDILLSVYAGFNKEDIKTQVNTVLGTLFSSSRVRYDNQLRMSWVHDYLLAIPGVKSISIRTPNPKTIQCTTTEIEEGTLPSQVGAGVDQIIVQTPEARVANFYVNYYIVVDYNTSVSTTRRVVASTSTSGAGQNCYLTLDDDHGAFVFSGDPYTFRHPRRLKLVLPSGVTIDSEDEVKNRRLVLRQPIGGVDDVERSIVSYDVDTNIVFVDRDYTTSPRAGTSAIVTPDYFVGQTKALAVGSVNLEIEDAF